MGDNDGVFTFHIDPIDHQETPFFRVQESHYHLHGSRTGTFRTVADMNWAFAIALRNAINSVLKDKELKDRDWLWFKFSAPNKEKDFTGLRVWEWRKNPYGRVSAAINDVVNGLQSNDSFMENERFDLAIVWADADSRGRRMRPGSVMIEDLMKKKETVVTIVNQDNLCFARALVTGIARHEAPKKVYDSIRRGGKLQRNEAILLHNQAEVPVGGCGIGEVVKFQEYLKDRYRLIVCYAGCRFKCEAFAPAGKPEIYLLHVDDHYHLITSLAGFLGTAYVCTHCLKGYDHEGQHKCTDNPDFCTSCRQEKCEDHLNQKEDAGIYCPDCNLMFKGPTCFQNHKTYSIAGQKRKGHTVCERVQACKKCGKFLRNIKEIKYHRCGYVKCPHCKKYVDYQTHKCYIQTATQEAANRKRKSPVYETEDGDEELDVEMEAPEESDEEGEEPTSLEEELIREQEQEDVGPPAKKKRKLPTVHVYFDIECRIDVKQHTPTLLVYWNETEDEPVALHGEDCVKRFLQYLENLAENYKITVIAHNFKGYDGLFVLRECYKNKLKVEQIRRGLKLLLVKHKNIRCIDSMSFIQGSLRSFNDTFGIPKDDIQKGYFPYLFYTRENEHYVGTLPEKRFYGPEHMGVNERPEFETWYESRSPQV